MTPTNDQVAKFNKTRFELERRFLAGEIPVEVITLLERMLEGDFETTQILVKDWPVWRTVEIGRHKNAESMAQALEAAGCRVSDWARDILGKTEFSAQLQPLELVIASVEELGFPEGATTREIYAAARARGLELCPAEVGPVLREQYRDQPYKDWVLVAMEPIADSVGDLGVFYVVHGEGGRWLDACSGHPGSWWDPGCRWVFFRSKQ